MIRWVEKLSGPTGILDVLDSPKMLGTSQALKKTFERKTLLDVVAVGVTD